jgi:hypothetical protein
MDENAPADEDDQDLAEFIKNSHQVNEDAKDDN